MSCPALTVHWRSLCSNCPTGDLTRVSGHHWSDTSPGEHSNQSCDPSSCCHLCCCCCCCVVQVSHVSLGRGWWRWVWWVSSAWDDDPTCSSLVWPVSLEQWRMSIVENRESLCISWSCHPAAGVRQCCMSPSDWCLWSLINHCEWAAETDHWSPDMFPAPTHLTARMRVITTSLSHPASLINQESITQVPLWCWIN